MVFVLRGSTQHSVPSMNKFSTDVGFQALLGVRATALVVDSGSVLAHAATNATTNRSDHHEQLGANWPEEIALLGYDANSLCTFSRRHRLNPTWLHVALCRQSGPHVYKSGWVAHYSVQMLSAPMGFRMRAL